MGIINLHPEKHKQDVWRCSTGFCFAGWVAELQQVEWAAATTDDWEFMSYIYPPEDFDIESRVTLGFGIRTVGEFDSPAASSKGRERKAGDRLVHVAEYAATVLGLSASEAETLFEGSNTREALELIVKGIESGDYDLIDQGEALAEEEKQRRADAQLARTLARMEETQRDEE
jgi:hypothetical protein